MDRALDDTGQHTSLQLLAVLTHAIIEDPILHRNVSRTVENHHKYHFSFFNELRLE